MSLGEFQFPGSPQYSDLLAYADSSYAPKYLRCSALTGMLSLGLGSHSKGGDDAIFPRLTTLWDDPVVAIDLEPFGQSGSKTRNPGAGNFRIGGMGDLFTGTPPSFSAPIATGSSNIQVDGAKVGEANLASLDYLLSSNSAMAQQRHAPFPATSRRSLA